MDFNQKLSCESAVGFLSHEHLEEFGHKDAYQDSADDIYHFIDEAPNYIHKRLTPTLVCMEDLLKMVGNIPVLTLQSFHIARALFHLLVTHNQSIPHTAKVDRHFLNECDSLQSHVDKLDELFGEMTFSTEDPRTSMVGWQRQLDDLFYGLCAEREGAEQVRRSQDTMQSLEDVDWRRYDLAISDPRCMMSSENVRNMRRGELPREEPTELGLPLIFLQSEQDANQWKDVWAPPQATTPFFTGFCQSQSVMPQIHTYSDTYKNHNNPPLLLGSELAGSPYTPYPSDLITAGHKCNQKAESLDEDSLASEENALSLPFKVGSDHSIRCQLDAKADFSSISEREGTNLRRQRGVFGKLAFPSKRDPDHSIPDHFKSSPNSVTLPSLIGTNGPPTLKPKSHERNGSRLRVASPVTTSLSTRSFRNSFTRVTLPSELTSGCSSIPRSRSPIAKPSIPNWPSTPRLVGAARSPQRSNGSPPQTALPLSPLEGETSSPVSAGKYRRSSLLRTMRPNGSAAFNYIQDPPQAYINAGPELRRSSLYSGRTTIATAASKRGDYGAREGRGDTMKTRFDCQPNAYLRRFQIREPSQLLYPLHAQSQATSIKRPRPVLKGSRSASDAFPNHAQAPALSSSYNPPSMLGHAMYSAPPDTNQFNPAGNQDVYFGGEGDSSLKGSRSLCVPTHRKALSNYDMPTTTLTRADPHRIQYPVDDPLDQYQRQAQFTNGGQPIRPQGPVATQSSPGMMYGDANTFQHVSQTPSNGLPDPSFQQQAFSHPPQMHHSVTFPPPNPNPPLNMPHHHFQHDHSHVQTVSGIKPKQQGQRAEVDEAMIRKAFTSQSQHPDPGLRALLSVVRDCQFYLDEELEPAQGTLLAEEIFARVRQYVPNDPRFAYRGVGDGQAPGQPDGAAEARDTQSIYMLFTESNVCLICGKKTDRSTRALGHVRSDIGHRPFHCDCEKCSSSNNPRSFFSESLLDDHQKGQVVKQTYPICVNTFRRGGISRHMASKHVDHPDNPDRGKIYQMQDA